MNLSSDGLNFIKQWESFKARPYDDGYGYLTIGYGHKIRPGESFTSLTESEAAQLLAQDVAWAEDAVNRNVYVPLTQSMFDALVSLVFNWGEPNFTTSSKSALWPLNNGDYWGASAALAAWPITSGGMRSQGLVNRRAAESGFFLRDGLPYEDASAPPVDQAPPGGISYADADIPILTPASNSLLPLLLVAGAGILFFAWLAD